VSDSVIEPAADQTFTLEQFPEKLAVVRAMRSVPKKAKKAGPFIAFAVKGPLDFALTGVLATLLQPLAVAEISVFTISTFDTDWLLVPVAAAERAAEEWRRSGHDVALAIPVRAERGGRAASAASEQSRPTKQEIKNS